MFRKTDFRPLAVALAVGLGVTACNPAESRNAPEDTEVANVAVPAGTSMTFTVDDDVASDNFRPGDNFTATLGTDVADATGDVVLEAGTKARWTVTEAVSGAEGSPALVAARLVSVQVDDDWRPVNGTITGTQLQPTSSDQANAEPAQTVKTGAEAEALIAQAKGTGTSAMAMGTPDTGSSATIAVAATNGAAKIQSGSRITVRLTDTLTLRGVDDRGAGY